MDAVAEFRVSAGRLHTCCDPQQLKFETTAELKPLETPLGQERALEALAFGTTLRRPGFNLFVLGPSGAGRREVVRQALQAHAASQKVPSDVCYVQNFADPSKPRALLLPQGRGVALRDAARALVQELRVVLPASFDSDDYRNRRSIIDERLKERQTAAFGSLDKQARQQGVGLIRTPMGFALAPIRDGNVLPPEEFARLPDAERERLEKILHELQSRLEETIRQVPEWQREHFTELRTLNQEVTRLAVAALINRMRTAFAELADVSDYLTHFENDIVERAEELFLKPPETPEGAGQPTPPGPPATPGGDPVELRRYQVNLLVDHSASSGAPIHFEDNPTHQNLVGRSEHYARFGTLFTDFTLLKPGALHKANGGYLVIDARKLLQAGVAWETLKRALRTGQIKIESVEQLLSLATTTTLEPEPIALDVKVVLIGDRELYYLLASADPEFAELFKIEVDFDDDVPRNDGTVEQYARLIARFVVRLGLKPLHRDAVARVIDQASRLAQDGTRLATDLRSLNDLLCEADHLCTIDGATVITADHVHRAVEGQRRRASRISERMTEEIARGTILIDVEGAKIGQVNGLSVSSLGRLAFGKPGRITANVRAGRGGVIDIERTAKLGGALHTKGVLILSGIIAATYAPERPLSLTASLVFEQSYGMIDGDSASSAELYALLSAIAEVPLRQDIAVTGSVNQKGEVQAIGGVNEKIEGFFDVCCAKGLSGRQGVLIPESNVRHLMLRDDVVASIEEGRFNVWAVRTIAQGIEILSGVPMGERQDTGAFAPDSLNARIERRLAAFARSTREHLGSEEPSGETEDG